MKIVDLSDSGQLRQYRQDETRLRYELLCLLSIIGYRRGRQLAE